MANLASLLCRWYVAFRSFRAHIRIQFATKGKWIDLGEACQLRDGRYQPNERTYACAEGIRTLLATHPWVDSVDVRLFLMGFYAGERYSTHLQDRDPNNLSTPRNQMQR